MDLLHNFLFIAFLVLAAAIHGTEAYAMVTGTVFCDQCKDGERSLFDYPIYGIKVTVACADSSGQITLSREETTNWVGNYAVRFDGTPDLNNCYAQVSPSTSGEGTMGCDVGAGPSQKPRLVFRMFGMEMYAVDSLLSQPAQPMPFCPKSENPLPSPPTPIRPPPEPVTPVMPPPVPVTPVQPPPHFRLPPLPPLPPMPPLPFVEASACSHQYWTMPEYRCYWRAVNPETKVAVIFGVLAAQKYGNDITLWQSLQGRGDPYRTLLREATTALLNSYNSLLFPYHSLDVVTHLNWALMGSQRSVLITGLRLLRANSGSANINCKFTPCK